MTQSSSVSFSLFDVFYSLHNFSLGRYFIIPVRWPLNTHWSTTNYYSLGIRIVHIVKYNYLIWFLFKSVLLQSKVPTKPLLNSGIKLWNVWWSWAAMCIKWSMTSVAGNLDNMLRWVAGGAQVYLLCPQHASRWLQWLQWWLRGEEGSKLLLIKPCKCRMQPQRKRWLMLGQMRYTCSAMHFYWSVWGWKITKIEREWHHGVKLKVANLIDGFH